MACELFSFVSAHLISLLLERKYIYVARTYLSLINLEQVYMRNDNAIEIITLKTVPAKQNATRKTSNLLSSFEENKENPQC